MLRHAEKRGLLDALNAAPGRALYPAREGNDKPAEGRQRWAAMNHVTEAARRS